jgi:4'-phosphopantetheinyl transferase EntD
VIERILPPEVAAAESFGDPAAAELFPEEEAALGRSVPARRLEFGSVRHCARAALARIGIPPAPLVPGERGAPGWPDGVVGSMTHCAGYRAAAVAPDRAVLTVGIDAEPHAPLPPGILEAVSLPAERTRLRAAAAARPEVRWDRLLFSAKEAVYKAWFPVTRRWLDFGEADIALDPDAGTFTARLLVPGPRVAGRELAGFAGRWLVERGLLVTAVAVPAGGGPERDPGIPGRRDADPPAAGPAGAEPTEPTGPTQPAGRAAGR